MTRGLILGALVVVLTVGMSSAWAQQVNFELFIDPSVPSDLAQGIRAAIPAALNYYNAALGRTRSGPFRAFFFPNIDRLWQKWAEVYNVSVEEARQRGSGVANAAGGRDIWMRVDDEGIQRRSRGRLEKIIAHEIFHLVQAEFSNSSQTRDAKWLFEGSAEYMGYRVVEAMQIIPWETTRKQLLASVFGQMTHVTGNLQASEGGATFDQLAQRWGVYYQYVALAVEYLVASDPTSLRQYYEGLSSGGEWRESFRRAFRQPPEEFYRTWDVYFPTQRP